MLSFKLFWESFKSVDIDMDRAYEIFNQEYIQITGKSWDINKFLRRAQNWDFYGDVNGFITVRKQNSGFVKLVGAAGSDKSKYKGFKELATKNLPVWGMVDDKIFGLLSKMGYRGPNKIESFMFKKFMTPERMGSVLGGATIESIEGNKVVLTYPDIGTVTKYYIASPEYWKKVRGGII